MLERYYLDENGNVKPSLSIEEAIERNDFEDPRKVIKQDTIGPYFISTIFLFIDHSFEKDSIPVLWETMVFKDDSFMDEYCERYTSKEDAIIGHEKVIKFIEDNIDNPEIDFDVLGDEA